MKSRWTFLKKQRGFLLPRILPVFLSLSLALPAPIYALRPENGGLEEETPTVRQIKAALLGPSAGLEESGRRRSYRPSLEELELRRVPSGSAPPAVIPVTPPISDQGIVHSLQSEFPGPLSLPGEFKRAQTEDGSYQLVFTRDSSKGSDDSAVHHVILFDRGGWFQGRADYFITLGWRFHEGNGFTYDPKKGILSTHLQAGLIGVVRSLYPVKEQPPALRSEFSFPIIESADSDLLNVVSGFKSRGSQSYTKGTLLNQNLIMAGQSLIVPLRNGTVEVIPDILSANAQGNPFDRKIVLSAGRVIGAGVASEWVVLRTEDPDGLREHLIDQKSGQLIASYRIDPAPEVVPSVLSGTQLLQTVETPEGSVEIRVGPPNADGRSVYLYHPKDNNLFAEYKLRGLSDSPRLLGLGGSFQNKWVVLFVGNQIAVASLRSQYWLYFGVYIDAKSGEKPGLIYLTRYDGQYYKLDLRGDSDPQPRLLEAAPAVRDQEAAPVVRDQEAAPVVKNQADGVSEEALAFLDVIQAGTDRLQSIFPPEALQIPLFSLGQYDVKKSSVSLLYASPLFSILLDHAPQELFPPGTFLELSTSHALIRGRPATVSILIDTQQRKAIQVMAWSEPADRTGIGVITTPPNYRFPKPIPITPGDELVVGVVRDQLQVRRPYGSFNDGNRREFGGAMWAELAVGKELYLFTYGREYHAGPVTVVGLSVPDSFLQIAVSAAGELMRDLKPYLPERLSERKVRVVITPDYRLTPEVGTIVNDHEVNNTLGVAGSNLAFVQFKADPYRWLNDPVFEGSLLEYPGVVVHELAHVLNFVMSQEDAALVEAVAKEALNRGLYSGDYAGTNTREWWAEAARVVTEVDGLYPFEWGLGSIYSHSDWRGLFGYDKPSALFVRGVLDSSLENPGLPTLTPAIRAPDIAQMLQIALNIGGQEPVNIRTSSLEKESGVVGTIFPPAGGVFEIELGQIRSTWHVAIRNFNQPDKIGAEMEITNERGTVVRMFKGFQKGGGISQNLQAGNEIMWNFIVDGPTGLNIFDIPNEKLRLMRFGDLLRLALLTLAVPTPVAPPVQPPAPESRTAVLTERPAVPTPVATQIQLPALESRMATPAMNPSRAVSKTSAVVLNPNDRRILAMIFREGSSEETILRLRPKTGENDFGRAGEVLVKPTDSPRPAGVANESTHGIRGAYLTRVVDLWMDRISGLRKALLRVKPDSISLKTPKGPVEVKVEIESAEQGRVEIVLQSGKQILRLSVSPDGRTLFNPEMLQQVIRFLESLGVAVEGIPPEAPGLFEQEIRTQVKDQLMASMVAAGLLAGPVSELPSRRAQLAATDAVFTGPLKIAGGLEESVRVVIGPTAMKQTAGLEQAVEILRGSGLQRQLIVLPETGLEEADFRNRLAQVAVELLSVPQLTVKGYALNDDVAMAGLEEMLQRGGVKIDPQPMSGLRRLLFGILQNLEVPSATAQETVKKILTFVGLEEAA